jgi:epoxyqueuosine reductase
MSGHRTEDADIELLDYLEKNGCFARVVSIDHLGELREEVRSLHDKGLLDEGFYHELIQPRLEPQKVRGMSKARSIFVTAIPTPATRVNFHWAGQTIELTIPPTYGNYVAASNRTMKLLREAFMPEKHWIARAILPVKLLAVRSGLALYGRNNITYIAKYGSFHTLAAVYTDFESPEDHWQEKTALPKCEKCRACMKACPTGAICEDRFLIRVENCLTYHNEMASSHPFPDWVSPESHNCIIGCMHCQRVCPYNREVIGWHWVLGDFTEDETGYLLKGEFSGSRAKAMDKKLKKLGLELSIFPRNLEVHLRQRGLLLKR